MNKRNISKKVYIIGTCAILIIIGIFLVKNIGGGKNISETADAQQIIFDQVKIQGSWNVDPTISANLFKGSKNRYAVINVSVKSVKEAIFLSKESPYPYTPIEVELKEVLMGNIQDDISTIYIEGGNIRISELLNHVDSVRAQKMGINGLTRSQKESLFIKYCSEDDYELKTGEEYALIVTKNINSGEYTVVAKGYGVFKEDENNADGKLKNVLTKNDLTDENGSAILSISK